MIHVCSRLQAGVGGQGLMCTVDFTGGEAVDSELVHPTSTHKFYLIRQRHEPEPMWEFPALATVHIAAESAGVGAIARPDIVSVIVKKCPSALWFVPILRQKEAVSDSGK